MDANPKKARDVFLAASKLQGEAREAYLREACGADQELHRRVIALLEVQAEIGSFHEAPAHTIEDHVTELPGAAIGPYKLVEPIGEGGMGTVWMAQQTEPVKRLVALKLIKAGMDSKQVIARFEAERQALALMDHPNIARVLDGGTTPTGRPYFVMDLVKGVPITRYCDEHHLTPRQRLELFIPVCQAVQHAHQKGIIHRDLKPSNVLVALYDGKPVPKVIDFGVAKAAGQPLTEQTLVTGFGNIVGTLEYMSPEQAEINQLDIDTRSDIYSLGVLLYELLTGSTPLDRKRLKEAAFTEMLRVIREEEPSRPSTKLSTAEGLPTLAANRGTEPAKLTKLVRGELDWIVMKALEKDRNRRYETANGFAMDMQRYLADEPVLACPPSAGYRLRKFARRNKRALTTTAVVTMAIIVAVGTLGWAMRDRAAREHEAAIEMAAKEAKAAANLLFALERAELFQEQKKRAAAFAALERAELLGREIVAEPTVVQRLNDLRGRLDADGKDHDFVTEFDAIRLQVQTAVDEEKSQWVLEKGNLKIREALEQYGIIVGITPIERTVARIQQRPESVQSQLLAAFDELLAYLPKNDAAATQWLTAVLDAADGDRWRAQVRTAWRDHDALERLAKEVDVSKQPCSFLLLVAKRLPKNWPIRLELGRKVQRAYSSDFWASQSLGDDLKANGKTAQGIRYQTAALALRPENAGMLLNRANSHAALKEWDAALADLDRALQIAPRYAVAWKLKAQTLSIKGDADGAFTALEQAAELTPKDPKAQSIVREALQLRKLREAARLNPKDYRAQAALAGSLLRCRLWNEAEVEMRKALEAAEKNLPESQDNDRVKEEIGHYARYWSFALDYLERYPDAEEALQKAVKVFQELSAKAPDKPWHQHFIADSLRRIALLQVADKRVQEAEKAYRLAIEIHETREARFPDFLRPEPYNLAEWATCYLELASFLASSNRGKEAKALYQRALERFPNEAVVSNRFAWFLATCPDPSLRDPAEAVQLAKKAMQLSATNSTYSTYRELSGGRYPYYHAGTSWTTLGVAHYRAGQWKEAVAALRKSMEFRPGGDGLDWFFLAMSHWKLEQEEQAQACYDRAVHWMDNDTPQYEELRRLRAEAEELLANKRAQ